MSDRVDQREEVDRQPAQFGDVGAEAFERHGVGELTVLEQVPDVLQADRAGQMGRVVLAVVVEAFVAVHGADRRVGHRHSVEPGRYVDEFVHVHECLRSTGMNQH